MTIVNELSSQVGDRTAQANLRAAALCLDNPHFLKELAEALLRKDADLVGDSAEVFTKVAEQRPELVAPYADALSPLLQHKKTRVRWEVTHALALVATLAPQTIQAHLPRLQDMIRNDGSIIVRDYAVDAVGNYAAVGKKEAQEAYPILKEALQLWDGKQAGHALNGLIHVARQVPALRDDLRAIGQTHLTHGRAAIQKAAKALIKTLER
jgi:hypothetical protein